MGLFHTEACPSILATFLAKNVSEGDLIVSFTPYSFLFLERHSSEVSLLGCFSNFLLCSMVQASVFCLSPRQFPWSSQASFYIFYFDSGPWHVHTRREQNTFNVEAEFCQSILETKGKKHRNEMLYCTICIIAKLLDKYRRKTDKQKDFSALVSNLLQQISWFQGLLMMSCFQACTWIAKLLQRSLLDVRESRRKSGSWSHKLRSEPRVATSQWVTLAQPFTSLSLPQQAARLLQPVSLPV